MKEPVAETMGIYSDKGGQNQKKKRNQRRFLQGTFARACCLLLCCTALALVLGLVTFAIIYSLIKPTAPKATSTTLTTTTSTSSTTTTSTSSTTTTSTSSTTTTTTSSTTTTSTSSTTTTTATSVTTTTTTTTTTTADVCLTMPATIFSIPWDTIMSTTTYTLYTQTFVPTNTNITVTFAFQVDDCAGAWSLDDVSLKQTAGAELLVNGGFETGSLALGWNQSCTARCTGSTQCPGGGPGAVVTGTAHTGTYFFQDRCDPEPHFDYLSQTISSVIVNQMCTLTYYLALFVNSGKTHNGFYVIIT